MLTTEHDPPSIEMLRSKAKATRPVISHLLHPSVIAAITHHRGRILASTDPEEITDYISKATDAECLCALSEIYLQVPLKDTFYRLFVHLAVKVFTELALDLPADIKEESISELTSAEQHELEGLRRGIRLTQKRTTPNGGH